MSSDRKRRLSWVSLEDVRSTFHKEPFPARGHRGDLGPLLRSISRHGLINPIIVRVKMGKLQVICGYRRWLACQAARLEEIPVLICRASDADAEALYREESAHSVPVEASARKTDRIPAPVDEAAEISGAPADRQSTMASPAPERVISPDEVQALASRIHGEVERDPLVLKVEEFRRELVELYRQASLDGQIRAEELEQIAERMRLLAPIEAGFDIRGIGHEVDTTGDAIDRLASHSLRVGLLAQHFAEACAWSVEGARRLGMAGLVHDIGMITIPAEWYDNPYPLTKSRREGIQEHTRLGMEMLQRSQGDLDELSMIARDHHERWDGTGYPAGKEGRRVALAARLIGLLDTYSALICRRPHRSAFWIGEAMRTLLDGSRVGIFEPSLVRQFVGILTRCPVGYRGKLADGRLGVVREVDLQKETGHRLELLLPGGANVLSGVSLWLSEDDLLARVQELPFCGPVEIRQDLGEAPESIVPAAASSRIDAPAELLTEA